MHYLSAVMHVTDVEQRSVDVMFARTNMGISIDVPAYSAWLRLASTCCSSRINTMYLLRLIGSISSNR